MDASFQRLARRQLSEALARYAAAAVTPRPRNGWIAALREALDMTARQFAARLGVTPSNVVRLEQRERDEAISLGALRRAADALDCDLVYAVVPRRAAVTEPEDSLLDALIEARAREVAAAELRRIAHTMALEDQKVRAADLEAQIDERAAVLAETPRRLWDPDVTPRAKQRSSQHGRPA
ncbi:MAG: mobile mystery protein A [Gemmatimonadaceae bacterium]